MKDLSHPLSPDTSVYPGDPPVRLDPHATHAADGYRVTDIGVGSHAGTHVDAPSHVLEDGDPLSAFPVSRFRLDAALVDLRPLDAGATVSIAALEAADPAPDCDLLVLRTGWDVHWGTDRYYDHPSLPPEAATWCADRGYDVALDCASPDPFGSTDLRAHRALSGTNRLIFENLRLGDAELPGQFRLHAYPLSFVGVDGSPVRAVAEPNSESSLDSDR
ncbi:cyclase family protein [Haloprofundus salinisoli]|uniref:cyclase family protein n=1 Tax=Haloprofundus salinisoli TaxID=2876193 RepID=UPI001CCF36B4|nr:cyclase family protein [Haloprofundus salinisoli]